MRTPARPLIRYAGKEPPREYNGVKYSTVMGLFRSGLDTAEIARRFQSSSEATIYNALHHAREAERAGR